MRAGPVDVERMRALVLLFPKLPEDFPEKLIRRRKELEDLGTEVLYYARRDYRPPAGRRGVLGAGQALGSLAR